jgi:hypothetical protein
MRNLIMALPFARGRTTGADRSGRTRRSGPTDRGAQGTDTGDVAGSPLTHYAGLLPARMFSIDARHTSRAESLTTHLCKMAWGEHPISGRVSSQRCCEPPPASDPRLPHACITVSSDCHPNLSAPDFLTLESQSSIKGNAPRSRISSTHLLICISPHGSY